MIERKALAWAIALGLVSVGLGWLFHVQTNLDTPAVVLSTWAKQRRDTPDIAQVQIPHVVQVGGLSVTQKLDRSIQTMPGHWGSFEKGKLQPNAELKVRFDHLLAQRSERPFAAMRPWVKALAEHDLGSQGGQAVVQIWDIYVHLLIQEEAAHNRMNAQSDTPERWITARLELLSQAQARLGPEWSEVFFAEDRAQVRQLAQSMAEHQLMRDSFKRLP